MKNRDTVLNPIYKYMAEGFENAERKRGDRGPRIGAELKFPLVKEDGSSAEYESVEALWRFLCADGWEAERDSVSEEVIGASKPGPMNSSLASCETGYSKIEFSLAHVADMNELQASIDKLSAELTPFLESNGLHLLCCGIHPVTSPSEKLLFRKSRTGVWDKVFGANRIIPESEGDDVCLFTINAGSHVHIDVPACDAIRAINVLNGFACAQIALTQNSSVWRGRPDPKFGCVSEKMWDWWMPDAQRVGVPHTPFDDMLDYANAIADMRPVFVKRLGKPIVLTQYESFREYYMTGRAVGTDSEGREISIVPMPEDIGLHNTCYWFNARLSRYFTVENRANDQQPPGSISSIAALTVGLVTMLDESKEILDEYDWSELREARESACVDGLDGKVGSRPISELASKMIDAAEMGLRSRRLGEEEFITPLKGRLTNAQTPADEARRLFEAGGIAELVRERSLHIHE